MKHNHGGTLFTGLLPEPCSAGFLTQPRPTAQEWRYPQWARPFQMNHQKGKHSTVRPRGQYDGIIFSVEIPSSQLTLAYVRLKKNLTCSIDLVTLLHKHITIKSINCPFLSVINISWHYHNVRECNV